MKKILAVLGASALLFASIFVTSCAQAAEGDTFYATTTIGTPDVTAKAYPGVNILTWKEIKDAGSYTIYRTVGNGKIEELKKKEEAGNVYIDTDIDENVNYKYRIVANPVDTVSHDASQTEVSLKTAKIATDPNNVRGTWAPEGTPFLDLAKYESDYDSGAPVLSEATIDAKLITSDKNSVRVSFPVKPYATYKVYIDSENSSEPASSKEINGYDYNGTATVTLDAASGTNLVVVVATPLNTTYYTHSEVAAIAAVSVSAKWTNYKSETKTANARIWFNPDAYGARTYSTDEYTVYRTVYKTMDSLVKSDGKTVDCNSVKLGTPKKDTEVEVNELPVYYYDDSLDITGVAAVRYYVILNHNGELKTRTSRLLIVGSADPDWNFTPYTPATPVYADANLYDVYITTDGKFHLKASGKHSEKVDVTYDTFDTLNEARVAVNSELKQPRLTTTSTEVYPVYDGVAVDTSKYYLFRVLATDTDTKDDDVAYVIAKAYKVGGAYYFEILSEGKPSNYSTTSAPTLTYDVEVGTTKYDSVTLEYPAYNAKYYNIYRKISSSSYYSDSYFTSDDLIDTVTTTTFTDTSSVLKNTSLDDYVYYKVEAVGYYNYSPSSTVRVSGLAAPEITLNASTNTITWSEVSSATRYYIYRAKTKAALEALTDSEYINTVYSSSSSVCTYNVSESSFSDYYYAVKAYRSSDYTYSNFSNVVTVYRSDIDVDLYSFNGSTYTWRLKWDKDSAYTGSYYILHYTAADEKDDASVAKAKFEANPNSYSTSTYNSSYYDVYTDSSSTAKEFYAVATKTSEYDEDYSHHYVWNITDVKEITSNGDAPLTVEGTSGNYTLSWDPIKSKDEKGVETTAAAYAVYEYTGYYSTWNNPMEYLLENAPKTVVTDGTSATSDASSNYTFFVVVGLSKVPQEGASAEDILATIVGSTNIVRK